LFALLVIDHQRSLLSGVFIDDLYETKPTPPSGIGEFSGQVIPIVGLWGGEGHLRTPDGWRLESRVEEGTVLSCSLIDPNTSTVMTVPLHSITEYRAVSFNPSGRFLLLASTGEVQVMARGRAGEWCFERAATIRGIIRRQVRVLGRRDD
jgi:hypothetical protein